MRRVWQVVVEDRHVPFLRRRMLGLTFLERRLREARKWGVDAVRVSLPPSLKAADLPGVKERHCAPWSVSADAPDAAAPDEEVYKVDLFALIDSKPPYATLLPVDPGGSFAEAVQWHRHRILELSNAGWVAKHLNKPVSLAISTRLAFTPITPNQWTIFNLLVGLASGVAVAQRSYALMVLGGLLIHLASVFDGVDGEIAKFRLEYSRLGAWLDTAGDNLALFAFLTGAGVHLARFSPLSARYLEVWTSIAAVSLFAYLGVQLHFCVKRLHNASLAVWVGNFVSLLPRSDPAVRLVFIFRRGFQKDFFSLLFFAITLTGQLEILLHAGTVAIALALVSAVYLNTRYRGVVDAQST